jgi:hypothetical protein
MSHPQRSAMFTKSIFNELVCWYLQLMSKVPLVDWLFLLGNKHSVRDHCIKAMDVMEFKVKVTLRSYGYFSKVVNFVVLEIT